MCFWLDQQNNILNHKEFSFKKHNYVKLKVNFSPPRIWFGSPYILKFKQVSKTGPSFKISNPYNTRLKLRKIKLVIMWLIPLQSSAFPLKKALLWPIFWMGNWTLLSARHRTSKYWDQIELSFDNRAFVITFRPSIEKNIKAIIPKHDQSPLVLL